MFQRKIKIGHLTSAKIWRGAEQQITLLYKNLAEKTEQKVFLPDESQLKEHFHKKGFPFISYQKKSGINLSLAQKILETHKNWIPDIYHIHDPHALNAYVLSTFLGNKIPAVVHRRVDFPLSKNYFSSYKYNHKNIKAYITVSEHVKKVFLENIHRKELIHCIYDGIDIPTFDINIAENILEKEFPQSINKIKVAAIAAIVDHKDYPTFLRTVKLIKEKNQRTDFHFFIIGKGEKEQEIKALCETYQLSEIVTFTGFRNDIPAIMKSLDIHLFTSNMEGLGSTLLECMAASLPIVACETGGAAEILKHQVNALTAKIGNEEILAKHVIELADNLTLKKELVQNAKAYVQQFSAEKMAEATLKIYHSIL